MIFQLAATSLTLVCARPNDIVIADQVRAHLGAGVLIAWRLASAPEILSAITEFGKGGHDDGG